MLGKWNVCNATELKTNKEIWWDKIGVRHEVLSVEFCCVLYLDMKLIFFLCFTFVIIFYYRRASEYDYEIMHISYNGEKYIVSLSK